MKQFSHNAFFLILVMLSLSTCKKDTNDATGSWGAKYTGNYLFTTINKDWETLISDTTIYHGSISALTNPRLKIEFLANSEIDPSVDDKGVLTIAGYGGGHDSFSGKFDSVGVLEFEFQHYSSATYVKGLRR